MSREILLELDDLLQAERELSGLLATIRADEQEARVMYARLQDWKGQSANVRAIRLKPSSWRCPAASGISRSKTRTHPICAVYETSGWGLLRSPCID